MNRRTFLATGTFAVAGVALGGCASRARPTLARPGVPVRLAPVRASWDRIIRTTVGLRPHRPSGFLLAATKLDDKTVIHFRRPEVCCRT